MAQMVILRAQGSEQFIIFERVFQCMSECVVQLQQVGAIRASSIQEAVRLWDKQFGQNYGDVLIMPMMDVVSKTCSAMVRLHVEDEES